jgi:hypothetical protein
VSALRYRLKGLTQEDLLVYQLIKNADTVGTRRSLVEFTRRSSAWRALAELTASLISVCICRHTVPYLTLRLVLQLAASRFGRAQASGPKICG